MLPLLGTSLLIYVPGHIASFQCSPPPSAALRALQERLAGNAVVRSVQSVIARGVLTAALLLAAATAAANLWGVPELNRRLIPQVRH